MPDHDELPTDRADAVDPTVARAIETLRAAVPVRREWRTEVLASAARTAVPSRRRMLVLSWPVAAAPAIVLLVSGAALSRVVERGQTRPAAIAAAPAAVTTNATRFVFVAPNAKRVALVGDFNLWDPSRAPMHRVAGTSAWEVDLPLPPGRHAYAFVVDGDVTADPSAPRTAGDDFGRPSSVVLVSSNRS